MALSFGWRANEVRESFWIGDPALVNVSAQAREAWRTDGDAEHLRPFIKVQNDPPSRITFRTLTPDESRLVTAFFVEGGGEDNRAEAVAAHTRATLLCFRIAVDFPDLLDQLHDPTGAFNKRIVKEKGVRMLANQFVTVIEEKYPGLVAFYGKLILDSSLPTAAEKKASSQPSTPTPSAAVVSMPATTEPSVPSGAA